MNSSAQDLRSSVSSPSNTGDYQVVNHVGTVFHTFDTRKSAVDWVKTNMDRFPGLRVELVTVTVNRVTVYRPRNLRVVA